MQPEPCRATNNVSFANSLSNVCVVIRRSFRGASKGKLARYVRWIKSCSINAITIKNISDSFARLGLLIDPGEEDVSGVVVQVLQLDAEDFDDAQGDGGEDGVTLFEEGIERTSEAIVIPLFEGHVKDDMCESVLCPLGNVGERDGLMGASGDEDAEKFSVRRVRLIIDGEMLVDDLLDAHAFEERHDDRKPSEWLAFNVGVFSVPNPVHERSLAGQGRMRKPIHYAILEGCGK